MKKNYYYYYLFIFLIFGTNSDAMQDVGSISGLRERTVDEKFNQHSTVDQLTAYFFSLLTYYINVVTVSHGRYGDGFLRRTILTEIEGNPELKVVFDITEDGVKIKPKKEWGRGQNDPPLKRRPFICSSEYSSLTDSHINLNPKELLKSPLWLKALKSYFKDGIKLRFFSKYYRSRSRTKESYSCIGPKEKIIRQQLVRFPHIELENNATQQILKYVLAELWTLSSNLDEPRERYYYDCQASKEEKEKKASEFKKLWQTLTNCSFNSEDNRNALIDFVKKVIENTIVYYGCIGKVNNEGFFEVIVDQSKGSFGTVEINGALLKVLTLLNNLPNLDNLEASDVHSNGLIPDVARQEFPEKLELQQQTEIRYDIPCDTTPVHLLRILATHRNILLSDYAQKHDHTLYLRIVSPQSLNFRLENGLLLEIPFAPFAPEDVCSPLAYIYLQMQNNAYLIYIIDKLYKHAFEKKMVTVSPDQIASRSLKIDMPNMLSKWPKKLIEEHQAEIKKISEESFENYDQKKARLFGALFDLRIMCKDIYTVWDYHSMTALFGDRLKMVRKSNKSLRDSWYPRYEKTLEQRINARILDQAFKEIKKQSIMNKSHCPFGLGPTLSCA